MAVCKNWCVVVAVAARLCAENRAMWSSAFQYLSHERSLCISWNNARALGTETASDESSVFQVWQMSCVLWHWHLSTHLCSALTQLQPAFTARVPVKGELHIMVFPITVYHTVQTNVSVCERTRGHRWLSRHTKTHTCKDLAKSLCLQAHPCLAWITNLAVEAALLPLCGHEHLPNLWS